MSTIPPIGGGVPPIARPSISSSPTRAREASTAPQSALWEVLTDEEQAYFQSMAALGPVSYGPGGAAANAPTSPVGQRVDLKA